MKATEGQMIVTFDCETAAFILQACFPEGNAPNCPACDQAVTPCQLGGVFNKAPWHKNIVCLIALADQIKPQVELTDKA